MNGYLELFHFNPVTFLFGFAVFAALLIILSKFVWTPVLKALDERDDAIRGDLDAAKISKEDSERLLAEQKVEMAKMKDEAKKIREEAISLAEKQKEEILQTAKETAVKMAVQAKEDLEREKEAAFDSIKELAISVGVDLASKLIAKEVKASEHDALIEQSMIEMNEAYKKAS
jgi:F-type H+-transporting ATPase subunit b